MISSYYKCHVKLCLAFQKFGDVVNNEIRCSLTGVNNYTLYGGPRKWRETLTIKRNLRGRLLIQKARWRRRDYFLI